jgi:hypothetical protein
MKQTMIIAHYFGAIHIELSESATPYHYLGKRKGAEKLAQ